MDLITGDLTLIKAEKARPKVPLLPPVLHPCVHPTPVSPPHLPPPLCLVSAVQVNDALVSDIGRAIETLLDTFEVAFMASDAAKVSGRDFTRTVRFPRVTLP